MIASKIKTPSLFLDFLYHMQCKNNYSEKFLSRQISFLCRNYFNVNTRDFLPLHFAKTEEEFLLPCVIWANYFPNRYNEIPDGVMRSPYPTGDERKYVEDQYFLKSIYSNDHIISMLSGEHLESAMSYALFSDHDDCMGVLLTNPIVIAKIGKSKIIDLFHLRGKKALNYSRDESEETLEFIIENVTSNKFHQINQRQLYLLNEIKQICYKNDFNTLAEMFDKNVSLMLTNENLATILCEVIFYNLPECFEIIIKKINFNKLSESDIFKICYDLMFYTQPYYFDKLFSIKSFAAKLSNEKLNDLFRIIKCTITEKGFCIDIKQYLLNISSIIKFFSATNNKFTYQFGEMLLNATCEQNYALLKGMLSNQQIIELLEYKKIKYGFNDLKELHAANKEVVKELITKTDLSGDNVTELSPDFRKLIPVPKLSYDQRNDFDLLCQLINIKGACPNYLELVFICFMLDRRRFCYYNFEKMVNSISNNQTSIDNVSSDTLWALASIYICFDYPEYLFNDLFHCFKIYNSKFSSIFTPRAFLGAIKNSNIKLLEYILSNEELITNISEAELNYGFGLCFNEWKIRNLFFENHYTNKYLAIFLKDKRRELNIGLQNIIELIEKIGTDLSKIKGLIEDLFKYINYKANPFALDYIGFVGEKEYYLLYEAIDSYGTEVFSKYLTISNTKFTSQAEIDDAISDILLVKLGVISAQEAKLISTAHFMEIDICYRNKDTTSNAVRDFFTCIREEGAFDVIEKIEIIDINLLFCSDIFSLIKSNQELLSFKIIRKLIDDKLLIEFMHLSKLFKSLGPPLVELVNLLIQYKNNQLTFEDIVRSSAFAKAMQAQDKKKVQNMLQISKLQINPFVLLLAWNVIENDTESDLEWKGLYEDLVIEYLTFSSVIENYNQAQIDMLFRLLLGEKYTNSIFLRFALNNKYLVDNYENKYEIIKFDDLITFNHPVLLINSYFFQKNIEGNTKRLLDSISNSFNLKYKFLFFKSILFPRELSSKVLESFCEKLEKDSELSIDYKENEYEEMILSLKSYIKYNKKNKNNSRDNYQYLRSKNIYYTTNNNIIALTNFKEIDQYSEAELGEFFLDLVIGNKPLYLKKIITNANYINRLDRSYIMKAFSFITFSHRNYARYKGVYQLFFQYKLLDKLFPYDLVFLMLEVASHEDFGEIFSNMKFVRETKLNLLKAGLSRAQQQDIIALVKFKTSFYERTLIDLIGNQQNVICKHIEESMKNNDKLLFNFYNLSILLAIFKFDILSEKYLQKFLQTQELIKRIDKQTIEIIFKFTLSLIDLFEQRALVMFKYFLQIFSETSQIDNKMLNKIILTTIDYKGGNNEFLKSIEQVPKLKSMMTQQKIRSIIKSK